MVRADGLRSEHRIAHYASTVIIEPATQTILTLRQQAETPHLARRFSHSFEHKLPDLQRLCRHVTLAATIVLTATTKTIEALANQ